MTKHRKASDLELPETVGTNFKTNTIDSEKEHKPTKGNSNLNIISRCYPTETANWIRKEHQFTNTYFDTN